jgi:hypothetical protein
VQSKEYNFWRKKVNTSSHNMQMTLRGDKDNVKNVIKLLEEFHVASGLELN